MRHAFLCVKRLRRTAANHEFWASSAETFISWRTISQQCRIKSERTTRNISYNAVFTLAWYRYLLTPMHNEINNKDILNHPESQNVSVKLRKKASRDHFRGRLSKCKTKIIQCWFVTRSSVIGSSYFFLLLPSVRVWCCCWALRRRLNSTASSSMRLRSSSRRFFSSVWSFFSLSNLECSWSKEKSKELKFEILAR